MEKAILRVKNLKTYFFTRRGIVKAVDGVDFDLMKSECLCLVGESGCGKTVTALSILGLIDSPPGRIVDGEVYYNDVNLLESSGEQVRHIRGKEIAMVFQDAQSALNPIFTIGDQIAEQIKLHLGASRREARERTVRLLEEVGIPSPEEAVDYYPHQLSGGMKQRAIAEDPLGINVPVGAAALVLPGDDSPTSAIGADLLTALGVTGSADCRSVGSRPLGGTRRVYPLGINIRGVAASVRPGDDSSTSAIGADFFIALVAVGGANCCPVGSPLNGACRVYTLGINIIVAGASVLPGDDSSTGAIGADFGELLVAADSADCHTTSRPLNATCRVYTPGINVPAEAAVVLPGDDSSTSAIGADLGKVLGVPGSADCRPVGRRPLGRTR